jgi:hypothetical protein
MSGAIALTSPSEIASPARRVAGLDDGSGWLNVVGILAEIILAPFLRRCAVHLPHLRTDKEPHARPFVKKMSIFPKAARSGSRAAPNKPVSHSTPLARPTFSFPSVSGRFGQDSLIDAPPSGSPATALVYCRPFGSFRRDNCSRSSARAGSLAIGCRCFSTLRPRAAASSRIWSDD